MTRKTNRQVTRSAALLGLGLIAGSAFAGPTSPNGWSQLTEDFLNYHADQYDGDVQIVDRPGRTPNWVGASAAATFAGFFDAMGKGDASTDMNDDGINNHDDVLLFLLAASETPDISDPFPLPHRVSWTSAGLADVLDMLQRFTLPGDYNADGTVDQADLADFAQDYISGDPDADINVDGVVNYDDVQQMIRLVSAASGPNSDPADPSLPPSGDRDARAQGQAQQGSNAQQAGDSQVPSGDPGVNADADAQQGPNGQQAGGSQVPSGTPGVSSDADAQQGPDGQQFGGSSGGRSASADAQATRGANAQPADPSNRLELPIDTPADNNADPVGRDQIQQFFRDFGNGADYNADGVADFKDVRDFLSQLTP